jgi:hypothetical protein
VRSVGEVASPNVVAAAATMAAYSYCDAASTTAACSQEAAVAAWPVARVAAKSDRAKLEAAEATVMVSGSRGRWVNMVGRWADADLYCSSWAIEEEQLAGLYSRQAARPACTVDELGRPKDEQTEEVAAGR